jgi:phosphatidylglycerophosphate synthase
VIAIVKKEKCMVFLERMRGEYRSSLKPKETEELVNQYINRPLAFITARLFYKLKMSPNLVTLFSMGFGVSSGFFFARGYYPHSLIAAILLQLMIIFDCADGQLARMCNKSSSLGKTLDGLADVCTHFSIFYGVAYAQYVSSGALYPFLMAVVAQLSMYLHIILFDHFKNVFIDITKAEYADKLQTVEELEEKFSKEQDVGSLQRLISRIYITFYKVETRVVSIGYPPSVGNFYDLFPDPERIDTHSKDMYYREMRFSVKLWSFIGDTAHLTLFVILGLMNKVRFILPVIIVTTNCIMVIALFYQRRKYKKLGLEREVLWQERLE